MYIYVHVFLYKIKILAVSTTVTEDILYILPCLNFIHIKAENLNSRKQGVIFWLALLKVTPKVHIKSSGFTGKLVLLVLYLTSHVNTTMLNSLGSIYKVERLTANTHCIIGLLSFPHSLPLNHHCQNVTSLYVTEVLKSVSMREQE